MNPTQRTTKTRDAANDIPPRSDRLFRAFRWYARRYCAKHLHTVRLAHGASPPKLDGPAIVVMNHPSWWDPLICFILSGLFRDRIDWGVIEASALGQYRLLGRAGLFGVESGTTRGAAEFLRKSQAILANPRATLWITGQGRFADARERPPRLRTGVGHLATRLERGQFVPLALEVGFWDQRTAEAFAAFGPAIEIGNSPERSAEAWTAVIERELEATQDVLARAVMSRDPGQFEVLIHGRAGVGGVYDGWRRFRAWLSGRRFDGEHRSGRD